MCVAWKNGCAAEKSLGTEKKNQLASGPTMPGRVFSRFSEGFFKPAKSFVHHAAIAPMSGKPFIYLVGNPVMHGYVFGRPSEDRIVHPEEFSRHEANLPIPGKWLAMDGPGAIVLAERNSRVVVDSSRVVRNFSRDGEVSSKDDNPWQEPGWRANVVVFSFGKPDGEKDMIAPSADVLQQAGKLDVSSFGTGIGLFGCHDRGR